MLADFTQGHTTHVAARHYANIPAHDELHDQAVEDGLREALDLALPPPVVLDEDGTRLDAGSGDLPPEQVQALLSRESDVFLASCRAFYDSPFGAKGKQCPMSLWGCLACPNAVFTTRHLPQAHTATFTRRMGITVAEPKPRLHRRRLPDWARSARARTRADKQLPWTVLVLGLIALALVAGGVLWLTLA
ncbi:hypothetical protein [Amycolatopsis sp. BJA-103]|uniref:hypothetical protein n=1 Tax=Amycolatopsis sp. BJA-103 TaxID=1911175 RepID=UPI000C772A62|nr:hypothetical protein [Amycolatopsis sp. BJA-103]AUI59010.1 hypothetical protein BKN51_12860 [Amycolatopsis sp. BJA-103]PNE17540.1 hypothetical protein B1H26_21670 [Amycolatopsis sp. BJA-103]